MSKSDGRDQDTNLRVLISQSAISRRKFLLASMSGAAATALEAGARPAAAAGGSLTSLTYSGQRWGAVQEGMAAGLHQGDGDRCQDHHLPHFARLCAHSQRARRRIR